MAASEGATNTLAMENEALRARVTELEALLNTPHIAEFFRSVELEAAHQRMRWEAPYDLEKTPEDWRDLVEHLVRRSVSAHSAGNMDKHLHHIVSSAAALCNWHRLSVAKSVQPGPREPESAR